MNKVMLTGRLTRDPEVRYTQGETPMCIARFTLAVDRRTRNSEGKQDADYPSCIAFGKKGEFVEKYFRQGMKADITGRIQTGSYTNKEGRKVYTTEVNIEDIEFGERKAAAGGATGEQGSGRTQQSRDVDESGFMNIPEGIDEELPFL